MEKLIIKNSVEEEKVVLQEGDDVTYVLFATEGWEGTPKLTFEIAGREARLRFLAFIIGSGKDRFNFETISNHVAPNTKAEYFVRAALFDGSMVDYKGNLVIMKDAQLTDTYLAHHTLLLSDDARARTIPALEIEADDVKAGHAATIGKVDKELLFYLKSRGIREEEAQKLLITGFFETQLQMIPDEKVRDELRVKVLKKLPTYV